MSDELPQGWAWATLGEIATTMRNGISTKPDGDSGLPILRISAVRPHKVDLADIRYLPNDSPKLDPFTLRSGDILFTRYNGSVDLVGVAAVVPALNYRLVHPDKLIKVQVPEDVTSPKFVAFAANIGVSRAFLASRIRTTAGQAGISGGDLDALPLPLAPRRLQDRIVQVIEQHFSDLDAGVAALERALANLKRYRASVLKAACEGRLVPTEAELARKESRDYEPADALLRRILKERRARWEADQLAKMTTKGQTPKDDNWKARYQEPAPPDESKLPPLPAGWVWSTIHAVGDVLLGRQRAPQYLTGRWSRSYLRVANIKDDRIDFSDLETMDFEPDHFEKYKLRAGDILASEGQSPELVGQSAIYRGGIDGLCFQKTLHRFRPADPGPSSEFAQIVFRAHVKTGLFQRLASITTNIAHLTLEKFEAAPFPLPPLAEQHRIVAEIDRLLSTADETEQALRAQLARAARLRQAVLKRAFEGKLVPQDPADEPASALLARLRSQKPADPKRTPRARARSAPRAD